MIEPTALKRGTTRVGLVAYCSNGFQSVACFRLRKIEIRPYTTEDENNVFCIMADHKVIVFGGNHHNTLGVVRSLGEKHIFPYVFLVSTLKSSLVLKSRYLKEGKIFKGHEEALEYIIGHFSNETHKPVIICTSDQASSYVDLYYDRLREGFLFPNGGEQGRITSLMDKEKMINLATETGLNIAKSWTVTDNAVPRDIEYPCITKPLASIQGSKADIKICRNNEELLDYFRQQREGSKIQVQKYIEKDFEYQLIGCSLKGGQQVIIPGFTTIIRSASTTNTGFLKYAPVSELNYDAEKCIAFIRACNYSGLFSLEFIRGKDQADYFLEINFRNDGNAYTVTAAGMNLPYIWVLSLTGSSIREEISREIKQTVMMPELVDINHVLSRKISLKKWLKDVRTTDCFLYYHKEDKRPFYFQVRQTLLKIALYFPRAIFKKIFR